MHKYVIIIFDPRHGGGMRAEHIITPITTTTKGNTMKKVFVIAIAALVLAGCNTISGVGRDVQRAGQIVSGAGGR